MRLVLLSLARVHLWLLLQILSLVHNTLVLLRRVMFAGLHERILLRLVFDDALLQILDYPAVLLVFVLQLHYNHLEVLDFLTLRVHLLGLSVDDGLLVAHLFGLLLNHGLSAGLGFVDWLDLRLELLLELSLLLHELLALLFVLRDYSL